MNILDKFKFLDRLGTRYANSMSLRNKDNNNKLAYVCPWSYFIGRREEGIMLLKTGALMRCYTFTCPDLGSASATSINQVALAFNQAIKRLGTGWCCHFESQRAYTSEYPGCSWSNIAGYLIDRRRNENYSHLDAHFVNNYVLSLTMKLPNDIMSKANSLLYKTDPREGQGFYNWEKFEKEIESFRIKTEDMLSFISSRLAIKPMDNDQATTYLHSCVSTNFGSRIAPSLPAFFDSFITDEDLSIYSKCLKLGENWIPIVAVRDFPAETYPAIFGLLNSAQVEYRWVTRWISMDKVDASKLIDRMQTHWYGSRKSWATAFGESIGNYESSKVDPAAESFESDVMGAKVELSTDEVSFGYYTSCLMVWDRDYDTAVDKAKHLIRLINSTGFGAKIETSNSYYAFRSMMPGDATTNVHKALLSSSNCAHTLPLSSVWTGITDNEFTGSMFACSKPLLVCNTASMTPFFLNLNVGKVGHTFIFGPSGAGKSTLLCLLESQFLKYRGANVVIFDKDKTARAITMAAGGVYVEPGGNDVAFQPLRNLDTERDISWAAQFIELLLSEQNVSCDAEMREAIMQSLRQMQAEKEPQKRTLTTFQQYCTYVSDNGKAAIRDAIQPYTINGEYGSIFDAEDTSIELSKWVMIEMGTLMRKGHQCVTPALMFLFHFIENIYCNKNGDPTGDPTLLVLDEAWVFLDNAYFAKTIEEWLVTLRKKNVFCVFATQEVAKAANSSISTTLVSQCLTKIYCADPSAKTKYIAKYYSDFGLEPNEIDAIANARMMHDYFYKSPLGCRMFELALDKFQLALLSPDQGMLDGLEHEFGRNCRKPLACEILARKGIDRHEYDKYL